MPDVAASSESEYLVPIARWKWTRSAWSTGSRKHFGTNLLRCQAGVSTSHTFIVMAIYILWSFSHGIVIYYICEKLAFVEGRVVLDCSDSRAGCVVEVSFFVKVPWSYLLWTWGGSVSLSSRSSWLLRSSAPLKQPLGSFPGSPEYSNVRILLTGHLVKPGMLFFFPSPHQARGIGSPLSGAFPLAPPAAFLALDWL